MAAILLKTLTFFAMTSSLWLLSIGITRVYYSNPKCTFYNYGFFRYEIDVLDVNRLKKKILNSYCCHNKKQLGF